MAHSSGGAVRTYVGIYVSLLLLTTLTVLLSTQAHLGRWELPVALGIATTKTVLVGLFFMHLIHSNRLTWVIIAGGALFFMVMILFTWADYQMRNHFPGRDKEGPGPSVTMVR